MNNLINISPMIQPWHKQEWEDERDFNIFCKYRDQPDDLNKRDSDKWRKPKYQRLARENKWAQRVCAYDAYLDELKIQEIRRQAFDMNKRHAENAQKALDVAMQTIMQYVKSEDNPNPLRLKPGDAIKLFDVAMRAERLARGEPDTILHADVQTNEISDKDKREYMFGLLQDPDAKKHLTKLREIATKKREA